MPSKAEADTVELVVTAEFVYCVELLDKRVGCAIGVSVARDSVELVPPSVGTAKHKRKRCQRQVKPTRGRYSIRKWRRRQQNERRISPGEQKGRQSLHVARVYESRKIGRGKWEPTQGSMFSAGHEAT